MVRNFKNIFSRPLFTIIFRPEMLKFHPYSILTGETIVGFVIYCWENLVTSQKTFGLTTLVSQFWWLSSLGWESFHNFFLEAQNNSYRFLNLRHLYFFFKTKYTHNRPLWKKLWFWVLCLLVNLLSFAKRSHNSNYCLSLTQDRVNPVSFIEKSDF